VAAGVAFFGGLAAFVAFLRTFVVLGVGNSGGGDAAEDERGEEVLERFHSE
jgi:hypothetical protein